MAKTRQRKGKIASKLDQYGGKIPNDLVLLPDYRDLDDKGILAVDSARWYEATVQGIKTFGVLMASAKELKGLSEDDPIDAGIYLKSPSTRVLRVDRCLYRGNPADGFYHA